MDSLELPKRIFILGEEPFLIKSIAYHTDDSKLFSVVRDALHDDEYEELKESRLGVFLKFNELDFGWASRLVYYVLYFQLNIKKKYELWSLVGAGLVRFSLIEFEHLTGLNCEYIENLEIQDMSLRRRWLLSRSGLVFLSMLGGSTQPQHELVLQGSFPDAFCDKNVKTIREKMAHDIYHETPGFEGIEDKSSYYKDLDTYE
ncbi:hypothetical protein N665_0473s0018 [Sinapis alba]|nr:hypothetical protein N665_0473s0018 [Sinapis alba]